MQNLFFHEEEFAAAERNEIQSDRKEWKAGSKSTDRIIGKLDTKKKSVEGKEEARQRDMRIPLGWFLRLPPDIPLISDD